MATNLSLQFTVPANLIPNIKLLPSPSELGYAKPEEVNLAIKRLYSLLSDDNIEVNLPYAKWTGNEDINWLMSVADNKRQDPRFVGFDENLLVLAQAMSVPIDIMSTDVQKFPFTKLGVITWKPKDTYLEWFLETRGYMRPLTPYQYQLSIIEGESKDAAQRLLWEDELTPEQQILLMMPEQLKAIGNWQKFAYDYLTQDYSQNYFDVENPNIDDVLTWKDVDLQAKIGRPFPNQNNYTTRRSMIDDYVGKDIPAEPKSINLQCCVQR